MSCIAITQELPPIQNFSTQDYNGENQNWGITQGDNGHIYIANNHNFLEYDGVRWRKHESPNASIFRSIKAKDAIIFTGQYMEFGYWKKDIYGQLIYTSISAELKEPMIEDEEFWNIVVLEDWVLFQSLDRIYSYNTTSKEFRVLDVKSSKAHIFKVDDTVYFQNQNLGIYKIENGELVLVLSQETLDNRNVVGMYKEENGLLVILDNAKFLKITSSAIQPWKPIGLNTQGNLNIYCTTRLNDGSIVLGTISKGIYQIGVDGTFISTINQQKGLNNNTVLSAFQDKDENLWLGLDNGLSVININSPFNEYVDNSGKLGLVYASIFYDENIYLGTNQGLFVKPIATETAFKLIPGTDGQVWSLTHIDDALFCGHNKGTFIVNNESAKLISSFPGTWNVKRVKGNSNVLLQGNYNGLSILKRENGSWTLGNIIDGFDISSRFFEFTGTRKLLVNHEYKGLYELTLDDALTKVKATETHPIMGYGSSLANYQEQLIYTSLDAAFVKEKGQLAFKPDSTLIDLLYRQSEGVTSILLPDEESKRLWCFTKNGLSFLYPKTFNASYGVHTIPIPSFFRRSLGVSGFENLTRIEEELYLIGISNGFVTLNLDKQKDNASFTIEIGEITNQNAFEAPIKIPLNQVATFKYDQNAVSFVYSVPQFNKYDEVIYQYKLEGLFDTWSDWSTTSNTSFNNLSYGDYSFKVRAKVGNTITENTASYSFTIERPWYLSNLALLLYGLGLIGFFLVVHRVYKSYYTRKQNRILDLEKKKLKRKKLKTQKELAQIKNEKLKSEIDSKNRELAVATMSMIKKNEFLSDIKKQLTQTDTPANVKAVIKTIDKTINNDDDWKFFQEAFNNVDKDFLKKVRELHPELTSNDLRLCAYLRLNLSSKEIAPLLNISVRSVEVKRYRLRKKMSLDHESGLVTYILNL